MFKQFISKVSGADVFMAGGFLFFFLFFIGVCVYLLVADKQKLRALGQIPLS